MPRQKHSAEEIIGKLRDAEVLLAQGKTVLDVCRVRGISEQSYDRWRNEYGGLKVDQARRLKEFEQENGRLLKAVADLTLDKLILKKLRRETSERYPSSVLRDPCARSAWCFKAGRLPGSGAGALHPATCCLQAR